MGKYFLKIALLLITFQLISCNSNCDCSSDEVCVDVTNTTNLSIENLNLFTHGIKRVSSNKLASIERTCLTFNSPGENTFNLMAILSNGDTLLSTEIYSEGGYHCVGTITKDTILIDYKSTY